MDNTKTILTIPWVDVDGEPYRVGGVTKEEDAYRLPIIFRATRLRCNSLIRVPKYIYSGDEIVESGYAFEEKFPLHDLLWLSEASLMLKGANYLLKLKNRYRFGKGLEWLNPFYMHTEYKNGEYLFYQFLPDGTRNPKTGFWTEDDFIYMREFNPLDDISEGVAPAAVALNAASASDSTSKFLARFFGSDALPITLITLPTGAQDQERERMENWFKKKLRGMRNAATRVLGVKGEIKLEKLTSDLNTYDFPSIDKHVLEQVSYAFDIPKSLLSSESANYATAQIERRIYMEDTIVPRCNMFERYLNPFLEEVGQRLEFSPQELPEMQEDEKERSQSLGSLVDAGIPLLAALDILGYDLSEDAQKLIEEAEKEKKERAERVPVNASEEEPKETQLMKSALDKWLRKSIGKLRTTKRADCEFVSDEIPPEMSGLILGRLKEAKTEEEVKAVFKEVSNGH